MCASRDLSHCLRVWPRGHTMPKTTRNVHFHFPHPETHHKYDIVAAHGLIHRLRCPWTRASHFHGIGDALRADPEPERRVHVQQCSIREAYWKDNNKSITTLVVTCVNRNRFERILQHVAYLCVSRLGHRDHPREPVHMVCSNQLRSIEVHMCGRRVDADRCKLLNDRLRNYECSLFIYFFTQTLKRSNVFPFPLHPSQ